jgi:hypothetical protein
MYRVVTLAALLSGFLSVFAAEHAPSGEAVRNAIGERDFVPRRQQSASVTPPSCVFSAEFTMRRNNIFQPKQGIEVLRGLVVWNTDLCLLDYATFYEHGPVYQPRSGGVSSRDEQGNFLLGRETRRRVISDSERNDAALETEVYVVSPDGEVLRSFTSRVLERYAPWAPDLIYVVPQIMNALGRGFSQRVQDILSIQQTQGTKRLLVRSEERFRGSSAKRSWTLEIDPEAASLVRFAEGFLGESDRPGCRVSNLGQKECPGLSLAASGTYISGPVGEPSALVAEVQLLSLTRLERSDEAYRSMLKTLEEQIDRPEQRYTEVIDHRSTE